MRIPFVKALHSGQNISAPILGKRANQPRRSSFLQRYVGTQLQSGLKLMRKPAIKYFILFSGSFHEWPSPGLEATAQKRPN